MTRGILLDTHVALWWLTANPKLRDEVRTMIDERPDVCISPVTVWEFAIKQAVGKLPEPADLPGRVQQHGFTEIPITFEHAAAVGRLPPIHRDPFDRMLVAQAQCEELTLVTGDPHIQKYDVPVLAV